MRLPEVREVEPLEKKFPKTNTLPLDLMKVSSDHPLSFIIGFYPSAMLATRRQ